MSALRPGRAPRCAAPALWAMHMPPHMATQCMDVSRPTPNIMPRLIPARATGKAASHSDARVHASRPYSAAGPASSAAVRSSCPRGARRGPSAIA